MPSLVRKNRSGRRYFSRYRFCCSSERLPEGFFAAIADEERTGNDVHNLIGIFVPDGAVQGQTVDFPLVITDNADLLLEGVIGFNAAAYGLLHGVQRSADFRDPCRLSGFHQKPLG